MFFPTWLCMPVHADVHIYIMMTWNVIIQFNAAISHKMEDGESIIIDKQICLQL
jgi:hypothetical protein